MHCKELVREVFINIANVIKSDKIRISKAFKSFEPNSHGNITLQIFKQTLNNMSFEYSDEEIDGIFIYADQDRDYAINLREFKYLIEMHISLTSQTPENHSLSPKIKDTLY